MKNRFWFVAFEAALLLPLPALGAQPAVSPAPTATAAAAAPDSVINEMVAAHAALHQGDQREVNAINALINALMAAKAELAAQKAAIHPPVKPSSAVSVPLPQGEVKPSSAKR